MGRFYRDRDSSGHLIFDKCYKKEKNGLKSL